MKPILVDVEVAFFKQCYSTYDDKQQIILQRATDSELTDCHSIPQICGVRCLRESIHTYLERKEGREGFCHCTKESLSFYAGFVREDDDTMMKAAHVVHLVFFPCLNLHLRRQVDYFLLSSLSLTNRRSFEHECY